MSLQSAKDYGLLATNYLLWLANMGQISQNVSIDKLSPEAQKHFLTEYRLSLGLTAENLPSAKEFEAYIAKRPKTAADFSALKEAVAKQLKADAPAPAAAQALKQHIEDALKLTPETKAAQKAFETDMTEARKLIELAGAKFHPKDLLKSLEESKQAALAALKAQQTTAVAALEAKFNNADFKENLKTTLGITDTEIDSTKANMLADLNKAHDTEYAAFEKGVNDPINKMHRAAQKERDRVAFLATLYENDKAVREEIDRLYEKNKGAANGATSVSFDDKTNSARFKGIKIEDLETLRTITGRPIKVTKKEDGSLSMSMQLPHRFFSSSYYFSSRKNIKTDMLGIMGALKACGNDKVTGNITHKNPEHAMELARTAYEAGLEAGFDEKNITIKVNNEVKTKEQLFADCPSRLSAAQEKAAQNKAEREKIDPAENNNVTYGRFRKALKEGRLAEETAQEAQVVPPTGPILGR